jgi:cytochrome c-type biogenesis protein CcmE
MKNISKWQKGMVIAIVLILAAFYGGMIYGQNKASTATGIQNTPNFMGRGAGNRGTRVGGGVSGNIVSKDATSITVQLHDGSGSRIVFYTGETPILKSVVGSVQDLTAGESVTVMGTTNSDGSTSAQSIQIRPAQAPGAPKN